MARSTQLPEVRVRDDEKIYTHPAYGTITMTTPTGGDPVLFGSDLGHNQRVCICVNAAELHRGLYRDWVFSRNQLLEIELSHAQFAQFITSTGNGNGTPVTIRWQAGVGPVPGIENIQTKHETQRQEVRECVERAHTKLAAQVAALREMVEAGKTGKKELRDRIRNMEIALENAPSDLAFAVESAETALEKATSDAKIEVESFVQMTAQRLGLKHINELALLANNAKDCGQ